MTGDLDFYISSRELCHIKAGPFFLCYTKKMKIIKINQKNFQKIVKIIERSIKQGKIMVLPTDTVYGLVCDATNKKAVGKLFKIKKRPKNKPIPIFVKDIKIVKKIAKIDKTKEKILKSVWPGKTTVVLNRKGETKLYGVDKKTIALRIPKYKLINELLKRLNLPFTGTSANISDRPASTKIRQVIDQFKKEKIQPDLIIDAGNLPKNKPSTVIDLTISLPKILRI